MVENYRKSLYNNDLLLKNLNLGAGTRIPVVEQKIKNIAKSSLSPVNQHAFLNSLVHFINAKEIVDIGTSFGLSAMYMRSNKSRIFSLEGNKQIAAIAQNAILNLNFNDIEIVTGEFSETLPVVLSELQKVDLVFFDGNHQFIPTLHYFEMCLSKIHSDTVFVFHDIYWSAEMFQAWKQICKHPLVKISVDLYYFGVIFFRNNQPRQHFHLKF